MNNRLFTQIGILIVVVVAVVAFSNRDSFLSNEPPLPSPTPEASVPEVPGAFTMVTHIQAEMPEQDAWVLLPETPVGMVERIETVDETINDLHAYSTNEQQEHDPFKLGEAPLGPASIGKELGFTMGEWLGGNAEGVYTLNGDTANLEVHGKNLVPKGLYTVWCSRMKLPPDPAVVDIPCGNPDGTENIVSADLNGNLDYHIDLTVPLEESTAEEATVIALAYHSDGKTYGPIPGDFGSVTHVQLFYLIPPPESE